MLHPRRISNICRYGAGAVVGSQALARRLRRHAAEEGRPELPVCVARLPVSPLFLSPAEPPAALDGVNYFVVCGTIEPRKNHLTLLNAWRVLASDPSPPKLVIVGKRGWLNAAVSKRWSAASPCVRMSLRRADFRRRDCADCLRARARC